MPVTTEPRWQRLSPVASLHFFAGAVKHVASNWQSFLPVLVIAGLGGKDGSASFLFVAGGGLLLLAVTTAMLQYWCFRFRGGTDFFEVRKGVLKRTALYLSFDRVQNVAISEPFYFRPFKTVTLKLDSAGSTTEEVVIAGVSMAYAEAVRTRILNGARAMSASAPDVATPAEAELILRQPLIEIAKHGLISNNTWLFAGMAGLFAGGLSNDAFSGLAKATWTRAESILSHGLLADIVIILGGAMATLLVFLTLSMLSSIVLHFDFRLYRETRGFRFRAGLFDRREVSLRYSKVQCLVEEASPVAQLLGRIDINLVKAGGDGPNQQQTRRPRFLIPGVDGVFTARFRRLVFPDFDRGGVELQPIHPRFILVTVRNRILPASLGAATVLGIAVHPALCLLAVAPLFAWPLVARYRRRYLYGHKDGYGVVRHGLFGWRETVFPFFKVQSVFYRQSPGQRRHGLASLYIVLAGRTVRVPYLPLDVAARWRDAMLATVASSTRPWI